LRSGSSCEKWKQTSNSIEFHVLKVIRKTEQSHFQVQDICLTQWKNMGRSPGIMVGVKKTATPEHLDNLATHFLEHLNFGLLVMTSCDLEIPRKKNESHELDCYLFCFYLEQPQMAWFSCVTGGFRISENKTEVLRLAE